MSEVGALVKEHIKSSVLDSGELKIIIREPKGNAWVGQHGPGLRGMVWGRERQGTILKPQDGKTFREKHVVRGEERHQRRVGHGRGLGKEEGPEWTKD